jgi:hypothetical protein
MSIPSYLPLRFAAPDCDVELLRQLLWHFPVCTRAYVHHSQLWLDPSSLFIPQQQRSRSREPRVGHQKSDMRCFAEVLKTRRKEEDVKIARR